MNELRSVVHITIFNVYVFIFLSIHNNILFIMCIINIVVGRCDNICKIENRVDWVGIEL
jgi:hypothetical protein